MIKSHKIELEFIYNDTTYTRKEFPIEGIIDWHQGRCFWTYKNFQWYERRLTENNTLMGMFDINRPEIEVEYQKFLRIKKLERIIYE